LEDRGNKPVKNGFISPFNFTFKQPKSGILVRRYGGDFTAELLKTPLYAEHVALGAKMVDFGGWAMPVQYQGIIEEHHQVRQKAGIFDVSHMGEIAVEGPGALNFLQYLLTNDFTAIERGQVTYSPMCYDHGGVVDDLLVYKGGDEKYLLVVNASNTPKDLAWIKDQAAAFNGVTVRDISPAVAEIALQGPLAAEVLQPLSDLPLPQMRYYHFAEGRVLGKNCLISRTGYTGEDGFEIYCAAGDAAEVWRALLAHEQVKPCGLGARDTLRFEASLPLYGHELSQEITPLEAGLGRFVAFDKGDFVGRQALIEQKEAGLTRKLAGFEMVDRAIPRPEYPLTAGGRPVGFVTSGSYSPTLDQNLGLGYLPVKLARPGEEIEVLVRGKAKKARVIKRPFYQRTKSNHFSRRANR